MLDGLLLLIALQAAVPQGPAEESAESLQETLDAALVFIEQQTDTKHASQTAVRCEEMIASGNFREAIKRADKTYGLKSGEWRALVHDCTIYLIGKMAGSSDQMIQQLMKDDSEPE